MPTSDIYEEFNKKLNKLQVVMVGLNAWQGDTSGDWLFYRQINPYFNSFSFYEWLEYVFIPSARLVIDERGDLPVRIALVRRAKEEIPQDEGAEVFFDALKEVEDLLNFQNSNNNYHYYEEGPCAFRSFNGRFFFEHHSLYPGHRDEIDEETFRNGGDPEFAKKYFSDIYGYYSQYLSQNDNTSHGTVSRQESHLSEGVADFIFDDLQYRIDEIDQILGDGWPQPSESAIKNMGAFGEGTMHFGQWLKYIFVPRVRDMVRSRSGLPSNSQLGTYAHDLRSSGAFEPLNEALLHLLVEFDRLVMSVAR